MLRKDLFGVRSHFFVCSFCKVFHFFFLSEGNGGSTIVDRSVNFLINESAEVAATECVGRKLSA